MPKKLKQYFAEAGDSWLGKTLREIGEDAGGVTRQGVHAYLKDHEMWKGWVLSRLKSKMDRLEHIRAEYDPEVDANAAELSRRLNEPYYLVRKALDDGGL